MQCTSYALHAQLENGLLMQGTVASATKQTIFHHSKVLHVIIIIYSTVAAVCLVFYDKF